MWISCYGLCAPVRSLHVPAAYHNFIFLALLFYKIITTKHQSGTACSCAWIIINDVHWRQSAARRLYMCAESHLDLHAFLALFLAKFGWSAFVFIVRIQGAILCFKHAVFPSAAVWNIFTKPRRLKHCCELAWNQRTMLLFWTTHRFQSHRFSTLLSPRCSGLREPARHIVFCVCLKKTRPCSKLERHVRCA